ncbi:hypothetical protein [Streptomyces spectabilis]|uniref:Uncharacterized protein n=1 Tax=Streptomyces spectabilis TaxID=68270 RepID=A0A7W8B4C4_STRST|nr:hypothetical protein [Streptomyces spectabilis]MBB5110124.1 hypothetical protein [Streptomyces spectabilis]GGV58780.1 hypothetical protein GCM10010245_91910 [Streptomyces spectabilis]
MFALKRGIMACALIGAVGGVMSPAGNAHAAAATPDICGGAASDYTGLLGLDTPFTGTANRDGADKPMTWTPLVLAQGTLYKAEINNGTADDRTMVANFALMVGTDGRGEIRFATPWGMAVSDNVHCGGIGTRVTKIEGSIGGGSDRFILNRA